MPAPKNVNLLCIKNVLRKKSKMKKRKKMLSKKLIEVLLNSEKVTKNNKTLQINLALNYGSKNELINAINLIKKKKLIFPNLI